MKESYTHYITGIEDSKYKACMETAKQNGYTQKEAEKCNQGELNCKGCPFKPEE